MDLLLILIDTMHYISHRNAIDHLLKDVLWILLLLQSCDITLANVAKLKCPYTYQFRCGYNGRCIRKSWICNGFNNCPDGSDEADELCRTTTKAISSMERSIITNSSKNKPVPSTFAPRISTTSNGKSNCNGGEFQCGNGNCITGKYQCDGEDDCIDGSDEIGCAKIKCPYTYQFRCGYNGRCIRKSWICNGFNNCPDGSDEADELCHRAPPFIPIRTTDTSTSKSSHKQDNRGAATTYSMKTKDTPISKSSHKDTKSGPIPELLIAMRSDVRKIRIDGQHYKNVIHTRLVQDVISLDVDIQSKMLYLADFLNQSIVRASLENNDKIEHVVKNVQKPEGIAFDWISKKIYWISTHPKYHGALEVSNADGSSRSVLVCDQVDRPSAVAVHPLKRLLFWTDSGKYPRIERASMDGLKRQVIIDSSQLTWPNGLTIDYTSDRIFWADSKRDYIGSSNLDGSNIITVAKNIHNPYSLTVFEDSIYWANRKTGKIFRISKSAGSITHEYEIRFYSPADVQIMHPLLQKAGLNPCAVNNGGCSHLCLLSSVKSEGYSCACATDFILHPDGRGCNAGIESRRKASKINLIAGLSAGFACAILLFIVISVITYKCRKNEPNMILLHSADEESFSFEANMLITDENHKERTTSFESFNSLPSDGTPCSFSC